MAAWDIGQSEINAQEENHPMGIIASTVDAQMLIYWNSHVLPRTSPAVGGGGIILNNPLNWWKSHEVKFPLVAKLARRLLSVPATPAPSERLFSDAGITIAKDRANLLPDIAASVIFLQDSWEIADRYLDQHM